MPAELAGETCAPSSRLTTRSLEPRPLVASGLAACLAPRRLVSSALDALARRVILSVLLGGLLASGATARTLHVAPNGTDAGPDSTAGVGSAADGGSVAGAGTAAGDPRADSPGDGSRERPFRSLLRAVALATLASREGEPVRIELAPGHYWLERHEYVDPTCGNCEDPATPVAASVGLTLSGRHVRLIGAAGHTSILHTRAGYGILVQDCAECAIEGLTVTDGIRDRDGRATDAAIVVQRSDVLIRDNWIRDNIGDPEVIAEVVVGVMGITGREGSRMRIEGNRILRNSWDGVALYRDAQATLVDNIIDGVDLALGRDAGGGRGVGIGLTWNARATVRGNRVTRYWKGIGVFVDAEAAVENNVVERIATWGLSLWDAGRGQPRGVFRGNVVDSTGACGAAIVRESAAGAEPGSLIGNVFSRTGQNPRYDSGEPYCFQTAVAVHAAPPAFRIEGNLLFDNREPGDMAGRGDRPLEGIDPRLEAILAELAHYRATRESAFVQRHAPAGTGRSGPTDELWGRGR